MVLGLDSRQQDGDASRFQPRHGVGQNAGTCRVDGRDPGHAQDHHPHVADVGDLQQEVVGRGEEQGAVQPVGDDVLIVERLLLVGVIGAVQR